MRTSRARRRRRRRSLGTRAHSSATPRRPPATLRRWARVRNWPKSWPKPATSPLNLAYPSHFLYSGTGTRIMGARCRDPSAKARFDLHTGKAMRRHSARARWNTGESGHDWRAAGAHSKPSVGHGTGSPKCAPVRSTAAVRKVSADSWNARVPRLWRAASSQCALRHGCQPIAVRCWHRASGVVNSGPTRVEFIVSLVIVGILGPALGVLAARWPIAAASPTSASSRRATISSPVSTTSRSPWIGSAKSVRLCASQPSYAAPRVSRH
jgi:hypothetical protein